MSDNSQTLCAFGQHKWRSFIYARDERTCENCHRKEVAVWCEVPNPNSPKALAEASVGRLMSDLSDKARNMKADYEQPKAEPAQ